MKRNVKLSLNRETLRLLTLDGQSLRQAVGAEVRTVTCLYMTGCSCQPAPSGNSGCHND